MTPIVTFSLSQKFCLCYLYLHLSSEGSDVPMQAQKQKKQANKAPSRRGTGGKEKQFGTQTYTRQHFLNMLFPSQRQVTDSAKRLQAL